MKTIEETIELLALRITNDTKPEDCLKITQSALNLAHTLAILSHNKQLDGTH